MQIDANSILKQLEAENFVVTCYILLGGLCSIFVIGTIFYNPMIVAKLGNDNLRDKHF
jgi:hypothetical protein